MRLAPNEIPPSSTMLVYSELFGAGLASSGITQQPNLNNAKQYMGGDGFESNLQAHYEFSNHQEMQQDSISMARNTYTDESHDKYQNQAVANIMETFTSV